MNEPITARVALPCTLRSPVSLGAMLPGMTEELARDVLLVRVEPNATALSLRPGLAIVVDVELPVSHGRSPRLLECAVTVRHVEIMGNCVRTALEVNSMTVIAPKTRAGAGGWHSP